MRPTPRSRFLDFIHDPESHRAVISPFLPHPSVVDNTLAFLSLEVTPDFVENEVRLAQALDYEPMFMTECAGLIFPWRVDEALSDEKTEVSVIETPLGPWVKREARGGSMWGDEGSFPVQTESDHRKLQLVCETIGDREDEIHTCFRNWRERVGENGVIVIGHPNPAWIGQQISQATMFIHWFDFNDTFRASVQAIYDASLTVFRIAMEEGIDFMSASGLGLEMTSPTLFNEMDLPVLKSYTRWVHDQGGLFWYHNCGQTATLIEDGVFNEFDADVIETFSPAPAGNVDLSKACREVQLRTCTKGNLDLGLLRDGTPGEVAASTVRMVEATAGRPHIHSTADAVLTGTPPENFIAFVESAREASERM